MYTIHFQTPENQNVVKMANIPADSTVEAIQYVENHFVIAEIRKIQVQGTDNVGKLDLDQSQDKKAK